jgi:hypothetical protein
VVIGCIYRPPNSDIGSFIDILASTLDLINNEDEMCFLLGTYIIHVCNSENHSLTSDFLKILYTPVSV